MSSYDTQEIAGLCDRTVTPKATVFNIVDDCNSTAGLLGECIGKAVGVEVGFTGTVVNSFAKVCGRGSGRSWTLTARHQLNLVAVTEEANVSSALHPHTHRLKSDRNCTCRRAPWPPTVAARWPSWACRTCRRWCAGPSVRDWSASTKTEPARRRHVGCGQRPEQQLTGLESALPAIACGLP